MSLLAGSATGQQTEEVVAVDTATTWSWPSQAVERALSYIRLVPSDLQLRIDYVTRDGFRLSTVDRVMSDPTRMPIILQNAATMMFGDSSQPREETATDHLSWTFADIISTELGSDAIRSSKPVRVSSHSPHFDMEESLVPEWDKFLQVAILACADTMWNDSLCWRLSDEDRLLVTTSLPELIREDPADKDKSPEELDLIQHREDSIAARFATLADDIRWQWIWRRGSAWIDAMMAALPDNCPASQGASIFADTVVVLSTPIGTVVFGTTGSDQFTGDPRIIIDPGGDDSYRLRPCRPGHPRLIVDWAGDDAYFAPAGNDLGAGIWSWGCLIDVSGDDTYRAGSFSLGAGWFGVGALYDLNGHDVYIGDTYTQGAGGFGIGVLYDGGTNSDQYTGRLFAQGFGFTSGIGILADAGGNDIYSAGGLYEDVLRYRDHHLSLSQGFGYGIRPHFSGGVGWLLDHQGNDVYVADIFGQGCSYWWGFGGLYDGAGNDQYVAFQYAQGSATHLTAGCLFDRSGDDTYFAKGVSQGCGHDWAAGLLIDAEGNDRYTATDLSQAAGSANGIGILIDGSGNDAYSVESHGNTQGYGNPRREYGSIGLFLDGAGTDRYIGPGADGRVWLGNSRWGVGVDADSLWTAGLKK